MKSSAGDATGPGPLDRGLLRWASREGLPAAVILPGRAAWGHTRFVDLREGGPRPLLAVAQPVDLTSGRLRPLRPGDPVRLWTVREGRPLRVDGAVTERRIMEARSGGPVEAAVIRLPDRLGAAPIGRGEGEGLQARLTLARAGEAGFGPRVTLLETWTDRDGGGRRRGEAALFDLTRRCVSFSLPVGEGPLLLPGTRVRVGLELTAPELRTEADAVVAAVFEREEHLLHGLVLGPPPEGVGPEEHREAFRRAAVLV